MIPQTMKAEPRWLTWRYVERDGKATKVPFQPNGEPAKSNDPTTWSTFEAVDGRGHFLGFVLGDGWFGVDLDECLDAEGRLLPWAAEIVEHFPAAYIETSPSGKGVKLFARGAGAEMKGRKKIVEAIKGGKSRAIEVYTSGRYFAVTGMPIVGGEREPGDCSAGLAWLLERHWPAAAAPSKPSPADRVTYPTHSSGSIEERASRYLEKCEPSISGQGGHNRAFHVAGQMIHGFGLSVDTAFQLMQSWNARCSPTWSDAELRRKCEQAAAATCDKPRGWLVNEAMTTGPAALGVDLAALDRSLSVGEPATAGESIEADDESDLSPIDPGPFPLDVIEAAPGILGEIVRHDLRSTGEPQPVLAFAAALALLSIVTGRKVAGHRDTRTNMLIVGLAPSGAGKDHGRSLAKDLLAAAGAGEFIGPERIGSHAGIITRMHKSPATLWPIDEIGDLFKLIKKNDGKLGSLANIEPLLKTLYSSAKSRAWTGDALANADHVKTINQPHLVLHGVCPPRDYWGNLTAANIEGGLTARFIVFEAGRVKPTRCDHVEALPSRVVEFLRNWRCFTPGEGNLAAENPTPVVAKYSSDALDMLWHHKEAIAEQLDRDNERAAAIWARCNEKASKLALIAACARVAFPAEQAPEVTAEDVRWGKRIANYSTRLMVYRVFDSLTDGAEDERKKTLLRYIPEWPGKITLKNLGKKASKMKPGERAASLNDLVALGMVFSEKAETTGRPATKLWKPARRKADDLAA